ncbi:aldehyde dehydrogenase family protein [Streptomyces sp. NPDC048751]|uniref:aldehyde dehydrogenase family protein n=1 Tax=Streptomyces sp. NPDC048751 TaxID=3365591 RepID=UPI00371B5F2A
MTNNNATITRDGVIGYDASEIVTFDQATGAEFARYPVAGRGEAAAAVAAARAVTSAWWDLGFEGRAERLNAWRRELALGGEEGAALIHAENGKSLEEARVEVLGTLEHLEYVIANAERVLGGREVPSSPTVPNQRAWVEYQPYGVVGVIGPWSFPLLTPAAVLADALAAGNAPASTSTITSPTAGVQESPASVNARPAWGRRRGPTTEASAVVSRWDGATRPSGSRTARAFGCRAVPVKPTTVAATVSACHGRVGVSVQACWPLDRRRHGAESTGSDSVAEVAVGSRCLGWGRGAEGDQGFSGVAAGPGVAAGSGAAGAERASACAGVAA